MKHILAVYFFCMVCNHAFAQSFYDIGTIQEVRITFDQSNWDYQMDTSKSGSEGFIIAAQCTINGIPFDSVGVKYKGNSSYNAGQVKNPLHIALDYVHGNQQYDGYTDVKLSNGFADPSFLREVLSYEILGNYMHCPRSNFAKVYINDNLIGLFSNSENIDKAFVDRHFYSSSNAFFKCNPAMVGGPGGSGSTSNLAFLGTDSSTYYNKYELKSDFGWSELIHLTDTLSNYTGAIEKILDVDRAIWMIAFNDVLVNLDSYTGAFSQNYFLYRDNNGRFNPIVWDLNMSFGSFTMLGNVGPGGGLDTTGLKNLSPLAQATNTARPLIQKLLANPVYKRKYIAHLRTITEEMFNSGWCTDRAMELHALVDQAVLEDPNKLFTYAQFQNSFYSNVAGGGGMGGGMGSIGILNLVNGRISYLNSTTEFQQVAPDIDLPQVNPAQPTVNQTASITAHILNGTSATLGYRYDHSKAFQYVDMFDDGLHGDGSAGDQVYGAQIPVLSTITEYYVYAENGNAGRFAPARAEHEFYTFSASSLLPAPGVVVINELIADNATGKTDEYGEEDDWLELYNNSDQVVNLSGMYLSDDATVLSKWAIPQGTILPGHAYLTVWADEDGGQGDLHANFKFKKSGELLILSDGLSNVLDSITFGEQTTDRSFGRYPNGTGSFTDMPPTFGAMNSLVSGLDPAPVVGSNWKCYPNPARYEVMIESDAALEMVRIFNSTGQLIYQHEAGANRMLRIPVGQWPIGLYWIVNHEKAKGLIIDN